MSTPRKKNQTPDDPNGPWNDFAGETAVPDGPWNDYADEIATPKKKVPTPAPPVDQAAIARQVYNDSPWYQRPFIAAGAEMNRIGRGLQQLAPLKTQLGGVPYNSVLMPMRRCRKGLTVSLDL
ncbi:hypothetical protein [Xylella fastidiosa]|uniref:hypothetical protein n=1 Tax=Xylella fastidiosa TaxID=2371 RepID=UPI001123B0DF|nr:hypothetical protein [Xylella fastidiosa]TNW23426.1 hypothetical protein EIP73_11685 [Xylella fastidiosa subsp. pauca]